jgi:threonine dehydratase
MIQAARERLRDVIYHSPCPYSLSLSRLCKASIYCKLDHLQMTGSFKERGARNKLLTMTPAQRAAGVIACSAGNHALGLSYHGQLLGVPVTVVMPRWAPLVKVANCRAFGATVLQHGDGLEAARELALAMAKDNGLTFIGPFDDPELIAGQGTMGLEILEDVPDVDAILVPVGGGGLISGIATAVKGLKPGVKVIGVESKSAPTLRTSLDAGMPTRVTPLPTLADGLAVAQVGAIAFEIARRLVDDVVLVNEEEIALAILRLLEMEKMVLEGAGAVPLAAAMRGGLGLGGKKVVLVLCGGNIDVTMISRIIERGLAADGRLTRISVAISDRPGSLARLLTVIGQTGASVKEVEHDRHFGPRDVALTGVNIILETRDFEHIAEIKEALTNFS